MSLMNDALRKKNREVQPAAGTFGTCHALRRSRPAVKWAALLAGVGLLTAMALIGLHWIQSGSGGTFLVQSSQSRPYGSPPDDYPEASSTSERPADEYAGTAVAAEIPTPAVAAPTFRPDSPANEIDTHSAVSAHLPAGSQATQADRSPITDKIPDTPTENSGKTAASAPGRKADRVDWNRESGVTAPRPAKPAKGPGRVSSTPGHTADIEKTDHSDGRSNGSATEIELFFKKALAYHRSGRTADAIRIYRQVLKVDPNHPAAQLNLAAVYMEQGHYPDAQPLLDRLERCRPRPLGLLVNLAIAAIGNGQPEIGLNYLDAAEASNDAPAYDIRFHRAVAHARMNRLDQALNLYLEATLERPDDPRLHFNIAVTCDALKRYPEALTHYEHYLRGASVRPATDLDPVTRRIRELRRYVAETSPERPHTAAGKGRQNG